MDDKSRRQVQIDDNTSMPGDELFNYTLSLENAQVILVFAWKPWGVIIFSVVRKVIDWSSNICYIELTPLPRTSLAET